MYIVKSSFKLWFNTVLLFTLGANIYFILDDIASNSFGDILLRIFLIFLGSSLFSFPVFLFYLLVLPPINRLRRTTKIKFFCIAITNVTIALLYTVLFLKLSHGLHTDNIIDAVIFFLGLSASSLLALLNQKSFLVNHFFISYSNLSTMDTTNSTALSNTGHNKILYKGIVTGILILVMLIPMIFVSNLVKEREQRRKTVEKDVSEKWASPQRLSGPYLYVPYQKITKDEKGKTVITYGDFFMLPELVSFTGNIDTEERRRSIYKVLLYKTQLAGSGKFQLQLPKDVREDEVQWNDIKLCIGISDFKGIEQEIMANFKGTEFNLLPGLPSSEIDSNGLSVNVPLSAADLGTIIDFSTKLAVRGSGQLHFMPLAGSSTYNIHSKWPSPSFDGNTIPSNRKVGRTGFNASWTFNKANLPFTTLVTDTKGINQSLAFGVSLLQPANQYAQTDRSSKYAILLIGLSFALFFIMEIMQNKPVHPVQYVLVGIALIIFYTLLLSISEIASFNFAYFVAASATILLITVYVHSHFKKAGTAAWFTILLSTLYGFIYILLRLEDTALLLGSIGLFIILAAVMYASRQINWYQTVPDSTRVVTT